MGVLVDNSRSLTPERVMAPGANWQSISRPSPNFGFTSEAHWFRLRLDNLGAQDLPRFVELPIPFIDDVQLYHSMRTAS